MKKRFLSLVLGLCLCLSLVPSVSAYEAGIVGQASTIGVGANDSFGFVDKNGALWMCGQNRGGELGNGTTNPSDTLVKVMDDVAAFSCSSETTAAVKTDGTLWMWGSNFFGALTGSNQDNVLIPKKVMDNVVAVSCGEGFTAAIKRDGSLWIWGNTVLGNGTSKGSTVPVRVMDSVAAVSCGGYCTAAIRTDGSLWMWGSNYYHSLGIENENPNDVTKTRPIKIMDDVVAVSCDFATTAAIKTDGSLWIWGANSYGQLLNGSANTFGSSAEPRKIMDNVVSVCCGDQHVAAVKTDGSLWTWGSNEQGELGNGGSASHHFSNGVPLQMEPVKVLENVASISCNSMNTVAIKKDGSVWGFGRSNVLCGISNAIDPYDFPMQTVPAQLTTTMAKLFAPVTIVEKVGGFDDVYETDYFADGVLWAVDKNITSGTSTTTFSPNENCTRAQILTFLWRAAGSPGSKNSLAFTDVKADAYYAKAAAWAAENGMVSGSTFSPDRPCTRKMAVEFMWKYAGSPDATQANFTDVSSDAVNWAVEAGVTSGTSATTFSPDTICTRGQIVTFLYRAFAK